MQHPDDPCITITCAICARPVDRVEWFDDLISMNRVIIAHCHGSKDEMRLSDRQLLALDKAARRGTILSAVAFSDPEKHPIPNTLPPA